VRGALLTSVLARSADSVLGRYALLGGSHTAGAFLGFLATIVTVRALGDTGYGYLAVGLAIQSYVFVLVSFGTELYGVQQIAREPETLARQLPGITLARLTLAAPVSLGLLGLALSGIWAADTSLVIGVFSVSAFFHAAYPLWAPQALERVGVVAAAGVAGHAGHLLLVSLVAWADGPVWGYAAAKVASDLLLAITILHWTRKRAPEVSWRYSFREVAALCRTTAPLAGAQIGRAVAIGLDIVILSLFVAPAVVGQYAIVFRIYTFLLSLATSYFVIVLPIFSRRMREGLTRLRSELRASLLRTAPMIVLGLGALLVLAEPILARLFGAEFAAATPALQVLALSLAANFLHRTYRMVLLAAGRRREDFYNSMTAMLIKMAAIFTLIPMFGMLGAAWGAVLGDLALLGLQGRVALRILAAHPEP
jgi:O-antigen/teichoic acid export membrane protein